MFEPNRPIENDVENNPKNDLSLVVEVKHDIEIIGTVPAES